MKKIFAIALAVVMVLSMTAAFAVAYDCETLNPSWNCYTEDTYCGKGTIEVVPYVKVNTACGWEYQVSDCAAAIRSAEVYYAIKLNVEAYPDPDFWGAAKYALETENLTTAYDFEKAVAGIDMKADEAKVYYLYNMNEWVDLDAEGETRTLKNMVYAAKVDEHVDCGETPAYDVCVTLKSYNSGVGVYVWGDYVINTESLKFDEATGKADGIMYVDYKDKKAAYEIEDGEVVVVHGDKATVDAVNEVLNLGCGWVCVVEDAIEANFGWDFEQKDCFDWSTKGASVVDTDCVVAIPKTGDASVLAWLF